jgi:hypothetical protein
MNKKQKVVLLVGVAIIVLMGLIPPWYYHVVRTEDQRIAFEGEGGYAFLFSPPSFSLKSSSHYPFEDPRAISRINLSRLLVQWAVVAIATAGIVLVLKDDNGRERE